MKKQISILISIAALVIGVVMLVSAQDGPPPGGPRHPRGDRPGPPPPPPGVPNIEQLTRDFSLSEAQVNELKPFLETQRGVVDGLREKLEGVHKQLREATAEGRFDEAQVRALAGQQAQTMTDLIVEQERTKAKIYNTLTAEQRARMAEMHKRGGPHRRGPGGPGGHGGPPPPPPPPNG